MCTNTTARGFPSYKCLSGWPAGWQVARSVRRLDDLAGRCLLDYTSHAANRSAYGVKNTVLYGMQTRSFPFFCFFSFFK